MWYMCEKARSTISLQEPMRKAMGIRGSKGYDEAQGISRVRQKSGRRKILSRPDIATKLRDKGVDTSSIISMSQADGVEYQQLHSGYISHTYYEITSYMLESSTDDILP